MYVKKIEIICLAACTTLKHAVAVPIFSMLTCVLVVIRHRLKTNRAEVYGTWAFKGAWRCVFGYRE